jgi:hypothetical protein
MPEKLSEFLQSLTPSEKTEIAEWFDENPDAQSEVIELLGVTV